MFSYDEFQDAVSLFGLIGLEIKEDIKKKYLKLSKQYHPDKLDGDKEKFQQINLAYDILKFYIDNFKFTFSYDEYQNQYPFSKDKKGRWSLW